MTIAAAVVTPQEQRIAEGLSDGLTTEEARLKRPRVERMLRRWRGERPPRICVGPALLYTESFKQTESWPLVIRAAKAFENIANKIDVSIGDDELLVGHCGLAGRYGVLYANLRGRFFEKGIEELQNRGVGNFDFTSEDIRVIKEEILPYWAGKTVHEAYTNLLPEGTRQVYYPDGDVYSTRGVLDDRAGVNVLGDWVADYEKVLSKGFNGIKKEAAERLASLDPLDRENSLDRMAFLKATIIVCDAMVELAKRYAERARNMAEVEPSEQRRKELLAIAEVCEWVPGNPARTFHEAMQCHWFIRLGLSFELNTSTSGNGRMDQFLYPYYEADIKAGRITKDDVLELLECHWLKQANDIRLVLLRTSPQKRLALEGYPHYEMVTIGGISADGRDGTNELSYLILQSRVEFPLNFPDLMVRVHSQTPQNLLRKACECVKEGTGFPKFLNDEEIIPSLVRQGATWEEARDYAGAGCTEVKVVNRDIDPRLIDTGLNLPAVLDMALNDGVFRSTHASGKIGVATGDPRSFATFDDVLNACRLQLEHLLRHCYIKQTMVDIVRPERVATPFHSCMHALCMKHCRDLNSADVPGAICYAEITPTGLATLVDSLAAVKKLVYDDKTVPMSEMVAALDTNFAGKEVLRQMCLHAPKYGNNDPYADAIGRQVTDMLFSFNRNYTTLAGGKFHLILVPVTSHVSFGAHTGATANGRKAGEPLSDGISPSHGADIKGPTAALISMANVRHRRYQQRDNSLVNMKFSPQAVAGDDGTNNMVALLRAWCDLKIWHIQFNIVNTETLRDAQQHPEKYRNLLVRVAGYSAYFVDLTPDLQEDIIRRTEHQYV